jgi:hypothetical protein
VIAAAIHGVLYLLPGLAMLTLAAVMNRLAREGIAAARGCEPAWARRWSLLAVTMIGGAGLALLVFGGALAWTVVRAQR